MKIDFKLIGTLKFQADGKGELTMDLPEGSAIKDALDRLGINSDGATFFHFAVVNGEKVEPDHIIKPGDKVKLFPRSFGG
jgi:sulfur carrier protein ThiS